MKLKAFLLLIPCLCLCSVLRVTAMQQEPAAGQQSKPSETNGSSNRSGNRGGGGGDVSGPSVALAAMDEDYKIGPNDVIDIQIEDALELSGPRRVNANGTFLMNYLGRLAAKGKTTEELARTIENGLRGRYLGEPRVTVTVKNFNSRSFFVQGAVHSPGVYVIEGRPTLLELVTVAGGLAQGHGSTAFIIRKIKPPEQPLDNLAGDARLMANTSTANTSTKDKPEAIPANTDPAQNGVDAPPQYTLLKANLYGLLKGRFEQNVFLEPGDVVNVPNSDIFFVGGEVKAPGSFPLKEGTTLRQAIALAQGENFKAAGNRTVIFREHPDTGKRQEIKVDLGAVLNGKAEDLPILANDIIIVPNSKLKSITAPMLNALGANAVRLPIPY